MAYVPPHLRRNQKVHKEVHKEFRQEFPQLATPLISEPALDFSHIKDIIEPVVEPVQGLPYGWVNLRDPSTYEHPLPHLNALATLAIQKMICRWEKWDYEHDIYVDYLEDTMDYTEAETESESDTISAEDPEYESDF